MNLVNELQVSAEEDDVLAVLRKTRRLASKLGRQDIAEWLKAEQEGYSPQQALPDYRLVGTTLALKTNGYVPAGYGQLMNGIMDLPSGGLNDPVPISESISTVLTNIDGIEKQNGTLFRWVEEGSDLSRQIRRRFEFDPLVAGQISFILRINPSQYRAIPERIKDKVLDWACNLEAAGVYGEEMSFKPDEREKAQAITFNLNGCNVEQLNNMGTNRRG